VTIDYCDVTLTYPFVYKSTARLPHNESGRFLM